MKLFLFTLLALAYGVAVFYVLFFSDFHIVIKGICLITFPYIAMEIDRVENQIS